MFAILKVILGGNLVPITLCFFSEESAQKFRQFMRLHGKMTGNAWCAYRELKGEEMILRRVIPAETHTELINGLLDIMQDDLDKKIEGNIAIKYLCGKKEDAIYFDYIAC